MKLSRELDVLVAEKVFGAEVLHLNQPHGGRVDYVSSDNNTLNEPIMSDHGVEGWRLKHYSTDISAAWEVVLHLASDGWLVETMTSEYGGTDVELTCISGARGRFYSDCMDGALDTAPHAICIAALKAYGVKT